MREISIDEPRDRQLHALPERRVPEYYLEVVDDIVGKTEQPITGAGEVVSVVGLQGELELLVLQERLPVEVQGVALPALGEGVVAEEDNGAVVVRHGAAEVEGDEGPVGDEGVPRLGDASETGERSDGQLHEDLDQDLLGEVDNVVAHLLFFTFASLPPSMAGGMRAQGIDEDDEDGEDNLCMAIKREKLLIFFLAAIGGNRGQPRRPPFFFFLFFLRSNENLLSTFKFE